MRWVYNFYRRTLRKYAVTVCDYKERWSGIVTSSHEITEQYLSIFHIHKIFSSLFSFVHTYSWEKQIPLNLSSFIFHLLRSK